MSLSENYLHFHLCLPKTKELNTNPFTEILQLINKINLNASILILKN